METDLAGASDAIIDHVEEISTTVWIAIGLLVAAILWLIKWAVTVLFVQGKGVSLVTIPFSRVAGKILEDRFVQKLADTKALPKLHVPGSWDEFNRFNGYVAHRMERYRELIYSVQTKFNGPSAVCLRAVVRFFEPSFVGTFLTAERGFRELDRIDAAVRAVHRRLHAELEERTSPLERRRIRAEKDHEMMRIRRKHVVARRPVSRWLRRRLGQFFGGLAATIVTWVWPGAEARDLRRDKRRLRAELIALRTEIAESHREIFAAHEDEVVGLCLELIEHDRMFLGHLFHRFGLEVESLKFTVASGQVLELLAADTEEAAKAREALGLAGAVTEEGPPMTAEALREWIRQDPDLQAYVGLGPVAVFEGTLEAFLRLKLFLGQIALPGYSKAWIAHLPPPGEFGRSQAAYTHFPHQLSWLKKPVPGLSVEPNGLVIAEEFAEGETSPPLTTSPQAAE